MSMPVFQRVECASRAAEYFGLMRTLLFVISLALTLTSFGADKSFPLVTLNCYWFFNGDEGHGTADKPRTTLEYSTKAGHLIGLLPNEAPLFVGFQEIGGGDDLAALARSASARSGSFRPRAAYSV
jgi:hypothetical protein